MDAKTVVTTIQLVIAPVVMITACSLILNGLLAHYSTINSNLRSLTKERLELTLNPHQLETSGLQYVNERIQQIDRELPYLLSRHKQIHDALFTIYCAIMFYVATMFMIALSAIADSQWASAAIFILFLLSTFILLIGVMLSVREIYTSRDAITFEVKRVEQMQLPFAISSTIPKDESPK
jgi:Protein of unknown function (DUF2721)